MPTIRDIAPQQYQRWGVLPSGVTMSDNTGNLTALRSLLRGEINRTISNPYAAEWRQAANRSISSSTRRALDFLKQQSALSGFRGMVDPNAVTNIVEQAGIASAQAERDIQAANLDLMKQQLAYREGAIAKLLGLETSISQLNAQTESDIMKNLITLREGWANRDTQLTIAKMQQQAQESAGLGSLFGGLLSGLGLAFGYPAIGSIGGLFGWNKGGGGSTWTPTPLPSFEKPDISWSSYWNRKK